jgi:copper transport protein
MLRRARLGAEGLAPAPLPSLPHRLLLITAVLVLALTAPMGGHSSTHSPEALLISTDTVHLLSMCVWLGGLVMLLVAVPLRARALARDETTPMLASVVGRFSRLALLMVAILVATGITQSIVLIGSFDAVIDTAYGRLVVVKAGVLLILVGLGAYNQRRSLPRLRRLAAGEHVSALLLRRAVTVEVALMLAVLAVTSVLVVTDPPAG